MSTYSFATQKAELAEVQPPFSTSVLAGEDFATPLVPSTFRNKQHMVQLVRNDVHAFLEHELNVERLNKIHRWLWLVGLPSSPRPLHYQVMKKREIVVAEQLDLHLVWSPARIFIKPVPKYLLSPEFWQTNICPYPDLYAIAFGLLTSYVALIEREVDYKLAVNIGLLSKEVTWSAWLQFAEEVMLASDQFKAFMEPPKGALSPFGPHISVNKRFYYGELRVGRLNWIYRIVCRQPRGYFSGCTTYAGFVRENINSFIALFAYASIVLSAMQVGLSTPWLGESFAFGMASYVFSVFAIIAPLSVIAALFSALGVLFTINLLRTLRIRFKRKDQHAGV